MSGTTESEAPRNDRETLFGSLADAGAPLAEHMTRDVRYVRPEMGARAVAGYLRLHEEREAPVVDDQGRPIGVVTLADLDATPAHHAREAMHAVPLRLPSSTPIVAGAAALLRCPAARIYVVTSDDVLAGVFSLQDLARWVLRETGHAAHRTPRPPAAFGAREARDVMRPITTVLLAGEPLSDARAQFDLAAVPILPVCREGKLVGVLAATDVDLLSGCGEHLFVEDAMRAPAMILRANTSLLRARRVLAGAQIDCAVIEDEGRVVGVLLAADLADADRVPPERTLNVA